MRPGAFWSLRERKPKRARGADAANAVRREKKKHKAEKKRKAEQELLSGATARRAADGSRVETINRPIFEPPSDQHMLVPKADVPTLDKKLIKERPAWKFAHRDDDGEWMSGKLEKARQKRVAGPAGGSEVRVTEFFFKGDAGTTWFRLNMADYGPTGEWVFWTLAPTRPRA